CRMIQGAPLQCWLAGRAPSAMRRRMVVVLSARVVAASLSVTLATVGALSLAVDGDMILMAQGANTSPSPAVAVTSRLTGSVEHRSNRLVWHLTRQDTHQINNFRVGSPARL